MDTIAAKPKAGLEDIVATEISPELLPAPAAGESQQATERLIGPYELHDFFLFQFLRYGMSPEKMPSTVPKPYLSHSRCSGPAMRG